jgi:bifunctional non-homologous end joining protein LigD
MPDLAELEPQLATLVDRAPQGDNWLYEIKFDGYRMLAAVRDGKARLRSRNHLDWTKTLPHIAQALGKLKVKQAVLDGELCYVGEDGRSSFQKLQNAMPRGSGTGGDTSKLAFYLFDVLFHDGVDVRAEPLVDRKHRLRILLGSKPPSPLVYSDHLEGDGHSNLLQACAAGLEGLIAKRRDAPYRGGRTQDWLKLKCQKRQEFVIAGMIRASGTRQGFRSLVLAVREGKALKFAGRVGTGFTQESLRDIAAQLARRVVTDSPLDDPPRLPGVVWVKPDLVAEIEYTEMTADGSLRHPSFQGLRRDKPARQVTRERAVPTGEIEDGADGEAEGGARRAAATGKKTRSRKTAVAKRSSADDGDDTVEGVRITHPERVMDEASGTTKLELARYHAAVGEHLMPYVDNRPLALVRCPQGDARQCFFQKHRMAGLGSNVHKSRIAGNEVLYVDSLQGVLELVQFNVVEFHAWGASMAEQDRPDWFVIDLDPDTALTFSHVVDAALEVRELLLGVGLQSWVKTTGGKGLHVVVPLRPEAYWDTVKGFTQAIAQALEARDPERYVATMSKAKRKNRIFVDYLRNGQGATAIVPYSPRTRPGMTVAMPVQWRDLRRVDPREFTVGSVPQYLARRRSDPWKDFLSSPQRLPDLDAGAVRPSRRRR